MKRSQFKRKSSRKPLIATQKLLETKIHRKIDLHRKAWETFSRWVRNRDKRCITCGSTVQLQAGHFWHACLDFDEMNINTQCKHCNHFWSGNLAHYSVYLLNKYGEKAFKDLEQRHWLALRGEYKTDQQYLDIIKKYELAD